MADSGVQATQAGRGVQATQGGPLLRAIGLTKRFGAVSALEGLTVDVPAGRIGLVGANGAGKTTFFRLLLGLTRPTEGSVEVAGVDVGSDPVAARAHLGFMPEHECLPPDQSAADVVATFGELSGLPASAARQRASEVLDLVGLDEARFRAVEGYSTGMKQRTKLAQALVADPELLLLDEPTAGLDPLGRQAMLDLVARLGGFGISVVLATHLLDDVQQVCDHVVMLDGGRLVVAGRTRDLLESTGVVAVEVDDRVDELAAALTRRSLAASVVDGVVEVEVRVGGNELDVIRDTIAELGLPLHRLSSRVGSLDEVFLRAASP